MEISSGGCLSATSEEAPSSICESPTRSSTWWRRRWCRRAAAVEAPSRTNSRAKEEEEPAEVSGNSLCWSDSCRFVCVELSLHEYCLLLDYFQITLPVRSLHTLESIEAHQNVKQCFPRPGHFKEQIISSDCNTFRLCLRALRLEYGGSHWVQFNTIWRPANSPDSSTSCLFSAHTSAGITLNISCLCTTQNLTCKFTSLQIFFFIALNAVLLLTYESFSEIR